MTKKTFTVAFAAITIIAFMYISCDKRETAVQPKTETGDTGAIASLEGTVTFLCGNATMTVGGNGGPLDIGTKIPVNAIVTTDADAICEIQFADFGSVHIDSGSSLTLNKFMADAAHTESEIALNAGKVVCKVRKLAGDDSFQVRTAEMVCGVRGTVFQVARDDARTVTIAVKEGAVAVYPPSVETATEMKEALGGTIRECAPVVAAGEEAAVEAAAIRALDAAYTEIVGTAQGEMKDAGEEPLEHYKKLAASIVTERAPVSAESAETFREASTLTLAEPAPVADAGVDAAETAGTATVASAAATVATEVTVSVTVEPADAMTTINGLSVVKGSFTGRFGEGTTLELKTEKEGYESATESITVSGTSEIRKTVSLAKKAEDTPAAKPAEPEPATAQKPKPVSRTFAVSQAKIVAVCASGDGGYFASDAKSAVSAVGPDGKTRWGAPTGNGTNTLNPPVCGGGVVAFAGDKNLAVFDAATGKRLWTLALDKSNTGLYGRRPVIAKGKLCLAGDSGLAAYDAKTGAVAGVVAFADGSDMSPAYANGMIYIVSKSGTWHKIDADTLSIAKSLETGATQPVASAPAVNGGTVVFADRKGTVTAVNGDAGTLLWQAKLDEAKNVEVFADPVIATGGVYVYAKGSLYALSLATGKPRFAPVAGAISAPCLAAGKLWYGAGTGASASLVAISPESGAALKKVAIPEAVSGTPLLAAPAGADGTAIVVPLAGGRLLVNPVE